MNYSMDVLALGMCLFSLVYIIYGRMKNHSLIGGYKPGIPGYEVFQKLISTRVLIAVCIATVVFSVSTVLDVFSVLKSESSHSVLYVAPIGIIVTFIVALSLVPVLLKKK